MIKKGNQEGMIVGSRGGYPGTKIGGSDTVKKISILLTLGNSSKMWNSHYFKFNQIKKK